MMPPRPPKPPIIRNLAVVSDLHCGSQLGLCPPVAHLDGGGTYRASRAQRKVHAVWLDYWRKWLPEVTHGEPFAVEVNGDCLDGRHHGSTDQISQNLTDQAAIAYELLAPVRDLCEGRLYMVRGTEAHVGPSGEEEEALARRLGAIPDADGNAARQELWIQVGTGLVHLMHHIGTAGSTHYESTAVMRELAEEYTEAGRHRRRPPDVVIRSHRHRAIQIIIPTDTGLGISMTTPGWQLKTPFVYRVAGARVSMPQIGGCLVRQGDEELHTRIFYRSIGRPRTEVARA